jgi:outer membrane protein
MTHVLRLGAAALPFLALIAAAPAAAQAAADAAQDEAPEAAPRRTRVALGPQLVPRFPGSDRVNVRPLVDVARARGDDLFEFEAADESFGPGLWQGGGFEVGPALSFEGKRSRRDTNGLLPPVGFTVELGGFAQYQVTPAFRLRGELRKGLGGHRGWIGTVGADYVARDGDNWLFSIGPRLTLADDRYNRAYFGVLPATAVASGVRAFDAKGGVQAAGVTAGLIRQITARWGVYGYAKYDRLVGDAGDSPVVRRFGTRNQLSGGLALTYTFGRGVR